jgi:hypothetical protein
VTAFQRIVAAFFDFIIEQEPSLRKFFKEGGTSLEAERRNNRNLFFRPIGLEVLARLYVHLRASNALDEFAQGLKRINFNNPGGIFDGVLWSAGKISASAKERTVAVDLCLYVLGKLPAASTSELQRRLREITRNANYELPQKLNPTKR